MKVNLSKINAMDKVKKSMVRESSTMVSGKQAKRMDMGVLNGQVVSIMKVTLKRE